MATRKKAPAQAPTKSPTKVYPETDIDRKWFEGVMRDRGITSVEVARVLGVHKSAVSLLLSGRRFLGLDESYQLAALFNLPQAEVAKAAGISGVEGQGTHVTLHGVVGNDGKVGPNPDRLRVPRPAGMPGDIIALQARTTGGVLAAWDGWTFYCMAGDGVPREALGKIWTCPAFRTLRTLKIRRLQTPRD